MAKAGAQLLATDVRFNANPESKPIQKYRFRNKFAPGHHGIRLNEISSPMMHRVQLLSTFMDLYLPKQIDKDLTSHFQYIARLPDVDLSTPLLQTAIDTVCLAELGSLYDDPRCLHEAQARYVRALPMLANELARPRAEQMRKDHILAAINVLAVCELFDLIASDTSGGQGWMSHVTGAEGYIKSNIRDIMASEFGQMLFHANRNSSLCLGLVKRKAIFFAGPQWLRWSEDIAKEDLLVAFYDIAVQIPGLLEQSDTLNTSVDQFIDPAPLCEEICGVRRKLDRWLEERFIHPGKERYSIIDVRDMKEYSLLSSNSLFTTVYKFNSVQVCILHQFVSKQRDA